MKTKFCFADLKTVFEGLRRPSLTSGAQSPCKNVGTALKIVYVRKVYIRIFRGRLSN